MATDSQTPVPDAAALGNAVGHAVDEAQALLARYAESLSTTPAVFDPMGVFASFQLLGLKLVGNPLPLWQAQVDAARQGLAAWQRIVERSFGLEREAPARSAPDKRFRDPEWHANPLFEFIRATYRIYADTLMRLALDTDGLDEKTTKKIEFYTRQFVDAMAPTNFALTNPEVLRATVESGGANLLEGLRNFLADIDPATGQ
ncbi:MAG: class I poly(R)-hydroxyalkanoic acid synthase, partial [Gammaproteobacteria bacterium]